MLAAACFGGGDVLLGVVEVVLWVGGYLVAGSPSMCGVSLTLDGAERVRIVFAIVPSTRVGTAPAVFAIVPSTRVGVAPSIFWVAASASSQVVLVDLVGFRVWC